MLFGDDTITFCVLSYPIYWILLGFVLFSSWSIRELPSQWGVLSGLINMRFDMPIYCVIMFMGIWNNMACLL